MNFFTRDLYKRFNSPDLDEAVRADAEWEDAIVAYRKHLESFRDELPPGAKKLAEELDLHDAEFVGVSQDYLAYLLSYNFIHFSGQQHLPFAMISSLGSYLQLILRSGDRLTTIVYSLWEAPQPRPGNPPWPKQPMVWLYDEVERDPHRARHFWHSILLNDESTIEIPFVDCAFHTFDLKNEEKQAG